MRTKADLEKLVAGLSNDDFQQLNDALDIVCSFVLESFAKNHFRDINDVVYDEFYKRWPEKDATKAGREIREKQSSQSVIRT